MACCFKLLYCWRHAPLLLAHCIDCALLLRVDGRLSMKPFLLFRAKYDISLESCEFRYPTQGHVLRLGQSNRRQGKLPFVHVRLGGWL
jgi:hypothetical protein